MPLSFDIPCIFKNIEVKNGLVMELDQKKSMISRQKVRMINTERVQIESQSKNGRQRDQEETQ